MPEDTQTPIRQVVFDSPGPGWHAGADFRQQPGVGDHVAHYAKLFAQGKLELGGPFMIEGVGGMMISVPGLSSEELKAFAGEDPAVRSGLLTYAVRPWYAAMDSRHAGMPDV